ncbi:hypothetical protein C1H46_042813 [Malus baccata]|uniref:Uncharacterized protein n=1 Tax=Malus baccata TaxID=106549 RepID=A0A540KBQ2_MALBA|nr:hypothetical protein C1H46_042813 [Malus baccata]
MHVVVTVRGPPIISNPRQQHKNNTQNRHLNSTKSCLPPQAIRNLSTILHMPRCPRCTKRRTRQSRKASKLTDLHMFSLQPRDNNLELPVQWFLKAA